MMFENIRRLWRYNAEKRNREKPAKDLQRFDAVQEHEQAFESVDRGVQSIPLDKIVGTVGRYQDFDQRFRPKRKNGDSRYRNVLKAMVAAKPLPPVSLYQIKDDYFVLDGHHRVTAARELGHSHIRAYIMELLPGADTIENRLYLERTSFRDKAGLVETVELTEVGQFNHLERQITRHQEFLQQESGQDVDFRQAAADWYRTIYKPLHSMIAKSGLVGSFPGRRVDDLYLYISVHQWEKGKRRNYGIGIDRLIPKDMEAFRRKMAEYSAAEYPEMKREIVFFMLLNIEGRYENQIMDTLIKLEEVDEIHSVHGSVDLIVKATLKRDLLSSDAELISQFTYSSIRALKGVQSTQTLIPGLSRIKERDVT